MTLWERWLRQVAVSGPKAGSQKRAITNTGKIFPANLEEVGYNAKRRRVQALFGKSYEGANNNCFARRKAAQVPVIRAAG
jgi:hypothetical protein